MVLIDSIEAIKLNQKWIKESENCLSSGNVALIEKSILNHIANKAPGINRVVYDITSKPQGTIEWE